MYFWKASKLHVIFCTTTLHLAHGQVLSEISRLMFFCGIVSSYAICGTVLCFICFLWNSFMLCYLWNSFLLYMLFVEQFYAYALCGTVSCYIYFLWNSFMLCSLRNHFLLYFLWNSFHVLSNQGHIFLLLFMSLLKFF